MPLSTHAPPKLPSVPVRPLAAPLPVRRLSAWPFHIRRDELAAGDILANARRVIATTAHLYREPMAAPTAPVAFTRAKAELP